MKWQSVETAPTDDTLFLAHGEDGNIFVVKGTILASARRRNTPQHLSMFHVTHWMPLPAPPTPN